jgi:hypothetical protein
MKLFTTNQNKAERFARFIVSLFLLPAPYLLEGLMYGNVLGAVGLILLFNAIAGTCYIYPLFGVDTCKI